MNYENKYWKRDRLRITPSLTPTTSFTLRFNLLNICLYNCADNQVMQMGRWRHIQ